MTYRARTHGTRTASTRPPDVLPATVTWTEPQDRVVAPRATGVTARATSAANTATNEAFPPLSTPAMYRVHDPIPDWRLARRRCRKYVWRLRSLAARRDGLRRAGRMPDPQLPLTERPIASPVRRPRGAPSTARR